MNTYPALTGSVVTEAHARLCRESGHAVHLVAGIDQGVCPRCGDVTQPAELPAETVAKFDRLLHLEWAVRVSGAGMGMAVGVSDFGFAQQATGHAADKARLAAAVDALSLSEMKAYGDYRLQRQAD